MFLMLVKECSYGAFNNLGNEAAEHISHLSNLNKLALRTLGII